jgi:TRAP-type uncharacterized transport system fused permease subunit
MFAFYFAILSAITPPVALAVFAAAGLAKSDLWATGWAAVKIGLPGFIIPFMFVYEPALLMIGDWPLIVWRSLISAGGVILFAAGLFGCFFTRTAMWQRAGLILAGLLLIAPSIQTDIAGFALGALVIGTQFFGYRSARLSTTGKT